MEILVLPSIDPDIDLDEGIMLVDCDGTGCKYVDPCFYNGPSIGMCC